MMNQTEFTNALESFAGTCMQNGKIDTDLYEKYEVQRGLRDLSLIHIYDIRDSDIFKRMSGLRI